MKNYEMMYEDFWKPILEPDGVLNMDRLKQELHGYACLKSAVRIVYDVVTGGILHEPNTDPNTVIWAFNEHLSDKIEQAIAEAGHLP